MGPERGANRDEGKSLKGEAQGRSGALDAPVGRGVDIAKGVIKPRTRYAAAEGSAVGKRVRPADMCRRAEGVQERKCRRDTEQSEMTARGPGDRALKKNGSPWRAAYGAR